MDRGCCIRRKIAKATEEQLLKTLYAFYNAQSEQDDLENITLRDLYPKWLEYKKLHTTAESYIIRINTDWKKYYLSSAIIDIPVRELDKLTLDKWVHELIKQYKMTKKTFYNFTLIARQTLEYAIDLKIITANPMKQVQVDGRRLFRKEKKKPDSTQVFSVQERKAIEELAWRDFREGTRLHQIAPLAIIFQFETGLRISELCTLRYEDVCGDYIHIQRMLRQCNHEVVEHTKSHEDRKVILTSKAKQIVDDARRRQQELAVDSEGYIFSINGKPPTDRYVDDLYRSYCSQLGILRRTSHKARKTYISTLIDNNVNINTVRALVGHADERTTYNSYCFDRSSEQEKIDKIENALAI